MQRVPGLRPTGQRPLARAPMRGRVQAPDPEQLRPKALRPVAQPVDTYVRPAEAPIDNGLKNLAESLRTLNPEIGRFLEHKSKGSYADALAYMQQNDIETVNQLIRSGQTPDVLRTLEGRRIYAERRALEDATAIFTAYQTDFAQGEGDLQGLFNSMTEEAYTLFANDDAALHVYTQTIERERQRLSAQYQTDAVEIEQAAVRDDIFGAWQGRIDEGIRSGEDNLFVVQSIFADFQNNRDFLNIPYKEQQEFVLQLAAHQVSRGNLDMAQALLQAERQDGPYRGNLLSDRDLGERANQLLSQIEGERDRMANAGVSEAAEQEAIAAAVELARGGSINAVTEAIIPDGNGGTRILSPDWLRERAAGEIIRQNQEAAAYNGWTQEQALANEQAEFVGSGLRHPTWFTQMEGTFSQLSTNNITTGVMPQSAIDGFMVYRRLAADSRHYVAAHLSQGAQNMFDVANLLIETGKVHLDSNLPADEAERKQQEDALRQAAAITTQMSSTDRNAQANFQTVQARADSLVSSSDTLFDWREANNQTYVKQRLTEFTTLHMMAGLSEADALAQAEKSFLATHHVVQGAYIKQDPRMPMAQFEHLTETYVAKWYDAHPDLHDEYDLDDLSIQPLNNGTGAYAIVGPDRMWLPYEDIHFTLDDLNKMTAAEREQVIDEVVGNSQPADSVLTREEIAASPAP